MQQRGDVPVARRVVLRVSRWLAEGSPRVRRVRRVRRVVKARRVLRAVGLGGWRGWPARVRVLKAGRSGRV